MGVTKQAGIVFRFRTSAAVMRGFMGAAIEATEAPRMTINAPNPRSRNIDPKLGPRPGAARFQPRGDRHQSAQYRAWHHAEQSQGRLRPICKTALASAQAELNGTISATAAELNGAISTASAEAADGIAGVQSQIDGLVIPSLTQPHGEHVLIDYADDRAYPIIQSSEIAWTIDSVVAKCASGSCTVTVSVDGSSLGGGANSVTTAESTVTHSTANTVASGATITVTISSNSSAGRSRYRSSARRASTPDGNADHRRKLPSIAYQTTAVINATASSFTFAAQAIGTASGRRRVIVGVAHGGSTITGVTVGGITATLLSGLFRPVHRFRSYRHHANIVVTRSVSTASTVTITVWSVYDLRSATAVDIGTSTASPLFLDLDVSPRGIVVALATSGSSGASYTGPALRRTTRKRVASTISHGRFASWRPRVARRAPSAALIRLRRPRAPSRSH